MRYAIISDIHANLAALVAVLGDIERRGGVDDFWCLGDIVGYGPDPAQCVELVRCLRPLGVAGNHDWAAVGKFSLTELNPVAATVCRWTAQQLTMRDKLYLENLPSVAYKDNFTLVHGSPREPLREYLLSVSSAKQNFSYFPSPFCLVGHSHLPSIFTQTETGDCSFSPFSDSVGLALGKKRMIINPGSVGQPRDGDPRASYAILDSEINMIRLHRVAYNIGLTQSRMVKQNLPLPLVSRLSSGT
ncbi:MAG: metallophosphoesterase family protein [Dehalococcoidales bacterium]|nr:metallophosphoesterase family protein [Dehalococcoidales bacterium]